MENNVAKSIADPAATQKIESAGPKPRRNRWASLRRWLRYATLAMLGVVFCVTLVFWIRSYWRIDHLHGFLGVEHRLFVRSGGGEIVFTEYTLFVPTPYYIPYQSWETRSYASGRFEGKREFGTAVAETIASKSDSERSVRVWWPEDPIELNTSTLLLNPFDPPRLDFPAHGVAFPHLLLLLIVGSLLFLILCRWRFSLRAFFIWVTIICVATACAVAFGSAAKEIFIFTRIT